MRCAIWCVVGVLLAMSTGCAESKLTRANVRKVQLGQTTEGQLVATFGKPDLSEERSGSAGTSKLMRWRLNSGGDSMFGYRSMDLRYLVADAYNGRVRSWMFVSTAEGDATKIRSSAVPQVVNGQSTRDDVLRLLGEPTGRALRGTLIEDYGVEFTPGVTEIWAWATVDNARGWVGGKDLAVRILLVKFEASGRVVGTITRAIKVNV